ncbi:MAG: hypothetical protein II672_07245 [Oscillospiraceae bacterium]|nr:hypothetical protein [Oscillospiraceae bacterium]
MDWTVLGIEPTTDAYKIEQAYNERLQNIDLENRPEEFTKLRAAYEEALKLSGDKAGSQADFRPGFLSLYADLSRRIDPAHWKFFLDEQDKALGWNKSMRSLLDELMDRHILPAKVWRYLEDRYHFSEQKEILYGNYPRAFVSDVILRGPSQEDLLPFELFVPGKSGEHADEYLKLFYQAANSRPDQTKEIFEKLNALPEQHPFGKALEARNAVFTGDRSKLAVLKAICGNNPGYDDLLSYLATAYMAAGEPEECAAVCEKLLESDKDSVSVKILYAQALAACSRYREASDTVTSVIKDPAADSRIVGRLSAMRAEWNMPVIRELQEKQEKGRASQNDLVDLSWRYLQNNMIPEAARTASSIESEFTDPVRYCDLMNQVGFVTGDYDSAIRSSDVLISLAERANDGLKDRLPEFFARKANTLYASGRKEEAVATYKEALDKTGNDRNILTMLCRILMGEKDYAQAAEYSKRMINSYGDSYMGHFLLAESLYGLGDRAAANAEANTALQMESGDLDLIVLKTRLLIDDKAFGDAETILDTLKRSGADQITAVKWCSALIKELKYHKDDEALDDYFDIAERLESGEYLSWASKVYYRIATVMGAQIDRSDAEGMQRVRDAVSKGLRIDPDDADLLRYLDVLDGKISDELSNSER